MVKFTGVFEVRCWYIDDDIDILQNSIWMKRDCQLLILGCCNFRIDSEELVGMG